MANESSAPHVLIVGGGAAGVTCALFLGRAGISSTIFDRGQTSLKQAYLQNYSGAKPVLGFQWLRETAGQVAATQQSKTVLKQVLDIVPTGDGFTVKTEDEEFSGKYVVMATGQGPYDFAASLGAETTTALQPYVPVNLVVDRWGETSVPGAFACGLLAGFPSQTVICAGTGANTAQRIVSQIKGEWWVDHDTLEDAAKARAAAAAS